MDPAGSQGATVCAVVGTSRVLTFPTHPHADIGTLIQLLSAGLGSPAATMTLTLAKRSTGAWLTTADSDFALVTQGIFPSGFTTLKIADADVLLSDLGIGKRSEAGPRPVHILVELHEQHRSAEASGGHVSLHIDDTATSTEASAPTQSWVGVLWAWASELVFATTAPSAGRAELQDRLLPRQSAASVTPPGSPDAGRTTPQLAAPVTPPGSPDSSRTTPNEEASSQPQTGLVARAATTSDCYRRSKLGVTILMLLLVVAALWFDIHAVHSEDQWTKLDKVALIIRSVKAVFDVYCQIEQQIFA